MTSFRPARCRSTSLSSGRDAASAARAAATRASLSAHSGVRSSSVLYLLLPLDPSSVTTVYPSSPAGGGRHLVQSCGWLASRHRWAGGALLACCASKFSIVVQLVDAGGRPRPSSSSRSRSASKSASPSSVKRGGGILCGMCDVGSPVCMSVPAWRHADSAPRGNVRTSPSLPVQHPSQRRAMAATEHGGDDGCAGPVLSAATSRRASHSPCRLCPGRPPKFSSAT